MAQTTIERSQEQALADLNGVLTSKAKFVSLKDVLELYSFMKRLDKKCVREMHSIRAVDWTLSTLLLDSILSLLVVYRSLHLNWLAVCGVLYGLFGL